MSPVLPEHGFTAMDLADLVGRLPQPAGEAPVLVAVNGPWSSGKTSLAARLAAALFGGTGERVRGAFPAG